MKKRIAIIIERADISLGGAERSVFELALGLKPVGFDVDILAAGGQSNFRNIHLLCRDNRGKRASYFTFAETLKKYLSENRYDLIHSVLPFDFADVYQPRGGTYIEAVLRNAASYQNKFLEYYKRKTAFINLRRTAFLRAERKLCIEPNGPVIVAISRYVAEQFKKHYGVADERIKFVANGVKINRQVNPTEAGKIRSRILAKLGLKEADNPVLFLFAANNFRLKGLAVLIKAMSVCVKTASYKVGRQAYLVVAGGGKISSYRRLANRLNPSMWGRRIVFLGPVRHIQDALSVIDVAVLPTFYDPCSRYILESLAAGKPVITTGFNGASEQFVNERHGKVIERSEDVPALAEAIDYFTTPDNIRKASEAIAADNLKEQISLDRAVEQMVSVYETIFREKGRK